MVKIIFKIDKEQDSKNWNRVIAIRDLPYGLEKKNIGKKMIKDFPKEDLKKLKDIKENLEEYFKKDGQEIFKTIKKITEKPIYAKKFYVSFTTAGFRPYDINSSWFMLSDTENFSKQLTDICHELLHLQVGCYYKDVCIKKGLTEKQFFDLNEILTFLINDPIFKKFDLIPDEGYPNHQEKRKKLEKVWRTKKDFNMLIDLAIFELAHPRRFKGNKDN